MNEKNGCGRGEGVFPDAAAHCCGAVANCPVEATIGLIGGKYKALIVWKLTADTLRFSQLRREVPAATAKMLTQQLRELEKDGLVRRDVYPVVPPKVEYSLTELGLSLRPILESMYDWGTGYLRGKGLAPNCSMTPPERSARNFLPKALTIRGK